ncbi:MAG TPA: MFS transporter [Chthoniobacterales bacterium]
MQAAQPSKTPVVHVPSAQAAVLTVLATISFCHLLNDTIQTLVPALYPLLKDSYHLSFGQIGAITLTLQLTASLLQPVVGLYTDYRPQPQALAVGMLFTLAGLLSLAVAPTFTMVLVSVGLIGVGSSVFHPEASRVARMASGGRHGFAQSLFQVGGNAGQSIGPLLAALIIVPHGQSYIAWFSLLAVTAMVLLFRIGIWYRRHHERQKPRTAHSGGTEQVARLPGKKIGLALTVLVALIFSKFFYLASISTYFTFYLIGRFHLSVQAAQVHLFIFLFSVAAGTILGGPLGDRFGRKYVIWISILGVAPFTLMLPYANLPMTTALTVVIGVVLSSAFSAILVYAQELIPGKVGMVSGLFFGFAFGMGGVGSALLGLLADRTSIDFVFHVCAFLPLIGLLTGFLPDVGRRQPVAQS